jgi:phosphoribosylformimino-5-aminoimidazole carboxamide ribotide isomerase
MQIIPAIDIIEGKCVRLTQGDYGQKKIYNEHPLEVAMQFEDAGLMRLHLVDLDGARIGAVKNWKVLEMIANRTSLVIDFGGGIKKQEDLQIVFNSGASLAAMGSIAVKDESVLKDMIAEYGAEKFLIGADVKEEKIAISGWLEKTDIGVLEFIKKWNHVGIKQIFCTDTSKDGKLEGPALELYQKIIAAFPELYLIASGGVSSMKDLEKLETAGCFATIVGKAIYEGRIKLSEFKQFI